jgi:hypothetical protein
MDYFHNFLLVNDYLIVYKISRLCSTKDSTKMTITVNDARIKSLGVFTYHSIIESIIDVNQDYFTNAVGH